MHDPLEHFEDQQLSYELIENSRDVLSEEARKFVSHNTDVEPVGLILDASALEARVFLDAMQEATGQTLDVPGFLGVVPRPFAVQILRASAPAALDNLPNGEAGASLPVLVATKGGFRFGEIEYSTWN